MAPGSPKAGVYCQTKFGVRGLTQALGTLYIMPHSKFINRPSALELAQTGITVNYFCPGESSKCILLASAD